MAEEINKGGRPPIWTDPKALETRVQEYFEYIKGKKGKDKEVTITKNGISTKSKEPTWEREPEPATITGLCLYLDFNSKDTLYNYRKNPLFSDSIKKGLMKVEQKYETNLHANSPTGSIFALKNMGWKDQVDTNNTNIHKIIIEEELLDGQEDKD